MALKKLVVGNWKMNGRKSDLLELKAIADQAEKYDNVDVGICVPATLIEPCNNIITSLAIGAQDCHANEKGAHTGCLSASMLIECGAQYIIVGHSERRENQGESDADVMAKAEAVMVADAHAILCIGESEVQRDSGQAIEIVVKQLINSLPSVDDGFDGHNLSIAYEPIWAIGTGRIPSLDDVAEMHQALRKALIDHYETAGNNIHILYGGSMNGGNAKDLMNIAHVDGGLVGGASLTAEKFAPVMAAA